MKPVKCPHCGKIFFDINEDNCPFCKNNIYIGPEANDVFGQMFGEAFDIFGGGNNKEKE